MLALHDFSFELPVQKELAERFVSVNHRRPRRSPPQKCRRGSVLLLVNSPRHAIRASGCTKVVICHPAPNRNHDDDQRHSDTTAQISQPNRRRRRPPDDLPSCVSQAQESQQEPLERAAIRQQRDSDRGGQTARPSWTPNQRRKASDQQCPSDGRAGPAPIALRPITQDSDLQHRQRRAQKCPKRWQPIPQGPRHGAAQQRHAQQNPGPRMTKDLLPERQDKARQRRIFGHVVGLLQNVNAFKENPQRMRRIRQLARGESIARKQIAELVLNPRLGRWNPGKQSQTQAQRDQREGDNASPLP